MTRTDFVQTAPHQAVDEGLSRSTQEAFAPSPYAQPPVPPSPGAGSDASAGRPSVLGGVPCPYCGAKMNWETAYSRSAMRWFGLVGILLVYPLTAYYVCPEHGLVDESAFPPGHRAVSVLRKVASVVLGLAVLALGVWVLLLLK